MKFCHLKLCFWENRSLKIYQLYIDLAKSELVRNKIILFYTCILYLRLSK